MNSLTTLRRLNLSFNKLTDSIPKLPPNLLELTMKANSLSGPLQKQSFEGMNQLEVVKLSENVLTGTVVLPFVVTATSGLGQQHLHRGADLEATRGTWGRQQQQWQQQPCRAEPRV